MNILTLEEAAALLRCSTRTLGDLAIRGAVPAAMIGGKYLFVEDQLHDWVKLQAASEMSQRQVETAPEMVTTKSGRKRNEVANWVANTVESPY